jgi:nucleoside-diphosphate-sugar epimerase
MGSTVRDCDSEARDFSVKVAVTGASGFVGRHVLAELGRHAVEVTAIARRVPVDATRQARWVELDIAQPPNRSYELIGSPDVLLHLAWGGLPNYGSLHHFESELPGQYAFLSGLVRQGLSALVAVGTCFEYGWQSGALRAEQETRPSNPYALAKDSLRKQLQHLRAATPFAFTWARLFYIYGEGQSQSSLFAQLRRAVERGEKVFPMSGGEQLRDYLPVEEAAKRLVRLTLDRTDAGPVNVCSGVPISVRRLVEEWIAARGWRIELALGRYPYSDYEPMAFWGVDQSGSAALRSTE